MLRKCSAAVLITLLLLVVSASAQTTYKSVEVKKFKLAEGVELSPEFPDFLYAAIRAELDKKKYFSEVISEGEVVDAVDEPVSLTVDGTVTEYKRGNAIKESLIGFGVGRRSLVAQVTVKSRKGAQLIDQTMKVRATTRMDEKLLARELAEKIVGEMKNELKLKKL